MVWNNELNCLVYQLEGKPGGSKLHFLKKFLELTINSIKFLVKTREIIDIHIVNGAREGCARESIKQERFLDRILLLLAFLPTG